MISYNFPEEKEFIAFLAEKIGDSDIPELLEGSKSISKEQAVRISRFFWRMIDLSVELNGSQDCPWPEGYEFWSEKVLQSVAAFLKNSGYENSLHEAAHNKS